MWTGCLCFYHMAICVFTCVFMTTVDHIYIGVHTQAEKQTQVSFIPLCLAGLVWESSVGKFLTKVCRKAKTNLMAYITLQVH